MELVMQLTFQNECHGSTEKEESDRLEQCWGHFRDELNRGKNYIEMYTVGRVNISSLHSKEFREFWANVTRTKVVSGNSDALTTALKR